jgi:hypothetical protein
MKFQAGMGPRAERLRRRVGGPTNSLRRGEGLHQTLPQQLWRRRESNPGP